MKIHEYQAKKLFKQYNIPIQDGEVLSDAKDIDGAIAKVGKDLGASQFVIKAQIHAGGRGKGGGVIFSPSVEAARKNAKKILGMLLVTPQTGAQGQRVRKIMITEAIDIDREFYFAITLDRSTGREVIIASAAGGMDIEEVARRTPEKLLKRRMLPGTPLRAYEAREIAASLGLPEVLFKPAFKLFSNLLQLYRDHDASIVEVNPLVLTKDQKLLALDGKIVLDDSALYRQPAILEMRDEHEEDPSEIEAQQYRLNFIKLDGNVGCMVNGAGLAMATMDIIKLYGGQPANFLDVGGTASAETVKNAFRIILNDPSVKAILINIFGGIVRCDRVAQGVVDAARELGLSTPVVVRLAGTNADIARKIIDESGVSVLSAEHLEDAAERVVALTKEA